MSHSCLHTGNRGNIGQESWDKEEVGGNLDKSERKTGWAEGKGIAQKQKTLSTLFFMQSQIRIQIILGGLDIMEYPVWDIIWILDW